MYVKKGASFRMVDDDYTLDADEMFVDEIDTAPTNDEIIRIITEAVQAHLDDEAKTHKYYGILSACTYATSTNPVFAAEAAACIAWRDAVWAYCYQVLDECQAGTRPIPTAEELIASLPVMVWP